MTTPDAASPLPLKGAPPAAGRSPIRGGRWVAPRHPVLVTGFEPFGGEPINPSMLVARALDGRVIEGRTVRSAVLPCVFGRALAALRHELAHVDPCLVVCTGQAGGRASLSIERVAINVEDAIIPDNAGAKPIDRPVVLRGPAAYFSRLPIKAIAAALTIMSLTETFSASETLALICLRRVKTLSISISTVR